MRRIMEIGGVYGEKLSRLSFCGNRFLARLVLMMAKIKIKNYI